MPRAAGRSNQSLLADEEQGVATPQSGRVRSKSWREQVQILRREVRIICLISRDPRTPWYAKVVPVCAMGYVFSPIQLIPSFIPLIGFLDDFLILWISFKLTRWLVPAPVIRDCYERAVVEGKRAEQDLTAAGRASAIAIAVIWLLLMAAATVWLYKP
jgi:uncharacterized membrane protein YkvA (DUF1232 family)